MEFKTGAQVVQPSSDAVIFDIGSDGATLQLRMSSPTSKEQRDFKGPVQFKLATVNHIIFVLCKFGSGPWMDAPYYIHLSVPFDLSKTLALNENRLPVHALLIDAATGILVDQRIVSFSDELTYSLLSMADNQPDIPDYQRRVNETYARYSTDDLLKMAVI